MPPADPDQTNELHRQVLREQAKRGKLSRTAELRAMRDEQKFGRGNAHSRRHVSDQFAVRSAVSHGRHTVYLTGELDTASSSALGEALAGACTAETAAVVLDLRELTFMDSSGMMTLLAARRLCAERECDFYVVPGQARVLRVFAVTGLLGHLLGDSSDRLP